MHRFDDPNYTIYCDYNENYITLTDPFRVLQYPIYRLLKGLFNSFPEDEQFPLKYTISLWRGYIRPWAFQKQEPWPVYIISNWSFYSSLFLYFLDCKLSTVLRNGSPSDVESISQLVDVFADENLLRILFNIDNVVQNKKQMASQGGLIVSHINTFEGGLQNYHPLFSSHVRELVQGLLGDALLVASQQNSSSPRIKTFFMPGKTSSLSKYSSADYERKRRILGKVSQSISKIFSIPDPLTENRSSFDTMRTPTHLTPRSSRDELSPFETPDTFPDYNLPELGVPGDDTEAFFSSHGMKQINPVGRLQIMEGKRKCSKMDVTFKYNGMYRPIETNEIGWLVIYTIKWSEWIYMKFGKRVDLRQLANISNLFFIFMVLLFLYFFISLVKMWYFD